MGKEPTDEKEFSVAKFVRMRDHVLGFVFAMLIASIATSAASLYIKISSFADMQEKREIAVTAVGKKFGEWKTQGFDVIGGDAFATAITGAVTMDKSLGKAHVQNFVYKKYSEIDALKGLWFQTLKGKKIPADNELAVSLRVMARTQAELGKSIEKIEAKMLDRWDVFLAVSAILGLVIMVSGAVVGGVLYVMKLVKRGHSAP